MSNLAGQRIKDTYDGVLHADGSSLTLGNGNSTDTIDANFNTVDVPVEGLKEGGVSHTSVSATTSVLGHVRLATNAEAHAATDTTRAITPSNLLIKKDGTAIVAGDLTGNSRGSSALDIQSSRSLATQVASGENSTTVGINNTASNAYTSAFGYKNTASSGGSTAVGYNNTSSGAYGACSSFGYDNDASGYLSSAIGSGNTADGDYQTSAIGNNNTASANTSSAIGASNSSLAGSASSFGNGNAAIGGSASSFGNGNAAIGSYSSAFGRNNVASGNNSSAFGYYNRASGNSSSAFGHYAKTTVNNTFEAGYWSDNSTRGGAIRIHPNGQVAMTMVDSGSAPTDGGATAGSEADGKLARGMFAIQKNGSFVTLYYNDDGDIQQMALGSLE
jgi:hypothetical protein